MAYRETIRGTADAEGKHKKLSGGHGQYGHCKIRFEPCEEDFLFDEEVVGGAVPKNYFPAVEKGLRECMEHGPLAGYPVVGVKAVLYDGSYHDVDSSEMAFKIAGSMALKDGLAKAKSVLLEPVMKVEVVTPDAYFGDVMGNVTARRGIIQGTEDRNGVKVVDAHIPLAEMFGYATDLRSRTQGRGNYTMQFSHYAEVPKSILVKIMGKKA